jgi:coenzyme F420-reducing hydrogenase beta subunit
MRTTLDIDDDLLHASKELARHEGSTAGAVVSRLLRQALTQHRVEEAVATYAVPGFRPFAAKPGVVVTNEVIDRLRDEEGI